MAYDIEKIKKQIIAQEARRLLIRSSYIDYVEYTNFNYKRSKFHCYLTSEVEKIMRGEITRAIINVPPQHGKSTTISDTLPSYYLMKNPHHKVIATAYGDELAYRFGLKNREKIEQYGKEFFDIELSGVQSSKTDWLLNNGIGGMKSVGIGGSITGHGSHLMIIDDPIKNREQANSETYREKIWTEWTDTLLTRLQPNSKVIIIMTRWHEDDLVGRLLHYESDIWHRIVLPAECEDEETDLLHRKLGETLWPESGRDRKWADETKRSVGAKTWAALYQQRPAPAEGDIFKRSWWRYYREIPAKFDEIIQSWDFPFKDKKQNAYLVGQVWGRIGARKYLLDQIRTRCDYPTSKQMFRALSAKWPKSLVKLVEDKANGSPLIQDLRDELPGIIPIEPKGDKVTRANAISATVEAGNVYLPDPSLAPWILDFIEELAAFPNSAFKDQVDTCTQALSRLNLAKVGGNAVVGKVQAPGNNF